MSDADVKVKSRIWYLSLLSFAGLVPGASHTRGRLTSPNRVEIDIDRVMTAQEIKTENLQSVAAGFGAYLKRGARTSAFNDEESAWRAGIAAFRSDAVESDLLLEGNSCVASPQRPLAGPLTLMGALSRIWEEFDRIDGWDGGEKKRADELSDEWERVIKLHCAENAEDSGQ